LNSASNKKLVRVVIAPEENSAEVIQHATKLGMVVCVGHTNATAKQTHDAITNGATATTHL
jgi:N-acetylglucosamine-6-phosphate deacetylase